MDASDVQWEPLKRTAEEKQMELYNSMRTSSACFEEKNDCAVVAMALVMNRSYAQAHRLLKDAGRKDREGTSTLTMWDVLEANGFARKRLDTKKLPTTVNGLKGYLNPKHRYLVMVDAHVLAVVDGVAQDWTADRKHRIQSVIVVTDQPEQVLNDEHIVKELPKDIVKRPAAGSKTARVWEEMDKQWEEMNKPDWMDAIRALRVNVMEELEWEGVAKSTISVQMGRWVKFQVQAGVLDERHLRR